MYSSRNVWLTSLAMFSLFFGAGNLILPPFLGFVWTSHWAWVLVGFALSAVLIPILGILAHARLQGSMFDFSTKVSPGFSLVYCILIYLISIALPSPRTASVTHEMAIAPLFGSPAWLTSLVYFILVYVFVLNRSRILDLIGKFLTPAILLLLMVIIGGIFISFEFRFEPSAMENPFTGGMLEGYQTFDAIGAVVVGGVILVSLRLKGSANRSDLRKLVSRAGGLAGLGLFLIYGGLILSGALSRGEFAMDISRTSLLSGLSSYVLGNGGELLLSLLVALACFTTAVGIVTGASDFASSRFQDNRWVYKITALLCCFAGFLVGSFEVSFILLVAVPALMFIYPLTICLILLNILPERFTQRLVFRAVVAATLLFSIPDFLSSIGLGDALGPLPDYIPLSTYNLGWVLPSLLVLLAGNLWFKNRRGHPANN